MELMNLSCEGFLEELASKAAAPGGASCIWRIFSDMKYSSVFNI